MPSIDPSPDRAGADVPPGRPRARCPAAARAAHGIVIAAVLLVILGVPACAPPPTRPPQWQQQLAEFRAGQRDRLEITDQPVTDADLADLAEAAAARPAMLRALKIDHAEGITDRGCEDLAQLADLEHLRLRGARIGDDGMRFLCRLDKLRFLNLPGAVFGNRSLEALAGLPDLELLRFSSPHVDDRGMQAIHRMPSLRFLHLIGVPITDEGLAPLAAMPQLESLYLDDIDNLTDEALGRLVREAPELHLHINQEHHDRDPRRGTH